jgi:hypothetical protein
MVVILLPHLLVALTIVVSILIIVILFLVLRVEVLGAVFFAFFAVLPIVAFAGNKRKHAANSEDTENELFHVRKLLTSSGEESKT